MRHLKSFEDFLKEEVMKRVSPNVERAKSLVIESDRKMRSIKLQLEKIGVSKIMPTIMLNIALTL